MAAEETEGSIRQAETEVQTLTRHLSEETSHTKGRREAQLEDPFPLVSLFESASSLLVVLILALACVSAFISRLFAVIRFESIIHEFDPWYSQIIILFVYCLLFIVYCLQV